MSDLDPAEVRRQHYPRFFAGTTYRCEACARLVDGEGCVTYRLAKDLAAAQGYLAECERQLQEWVARVAPAEIRAEEAESALAAEQAKIARVEELAHRFELIPRARLLGALAARPVNVSGLDDMRDNEGAGQAAPA